MNQHRECLLCHSVNLVNLKGFERAHLCKCGNCGLVFSRQIPTQKELSDYYNLYSPNPYLSPLTIKRYHELLDKFEPFRKTNKILDVGCGSGYFLEEAKKRGWEVYGSELSAHYVKVCQKKGIHMFHGVLDTSAFPGETFDIVTYFEVIEHINTPIEELTLFHKILRKGGLVYVTTPNFNSILRYKLKEKYNVITYPEHLIYFTPATLASAFRIAGFRKLRSETTGMSLTRLRMGKESVKHEVVSAKSDDEKLRAKLEKGWHLKMAKLLANKALTLSGKGDTIKGWFVKP